MVDYTLQNPGIVNNAGDPKALFYKVFSGEVLMAFEQACVMKDRVQGRSITYTSRSVQQRGWSWNTDCPVTLLPDALTGELRLPTNALKVDTVGGSERLSLVQRGSRLYDPATQSYKFERPVAVAIVAGLDWPDLPEAARRFILISAGRKFTQDTLGSDTLSNFLKSDESMAWADLLSADLEVGDYNMLTDSWAVARVLAR